ncbi:MAG: hypothetical protein JW771_00250 [Candidatus Thermoplasmatota archaeon]|nr:hypothetical protein [Candidatus Thermoplasmatota archaeon]
METNVVSFIVENIFLFLPIGVIGIVVTLYLYFTGKREEDEQKEHLTADYFTISSFTINIYSIVYLFICVMIVIIALLSNFIIPAIVGSVCASIPLVLMGIIQWKYRKHEVP